MLEIFQFFSKNISKILKEKLINQTKEKQSELEEIRIRSNGSLMLKYAEEDELLTKNIPYQDIIETIQIMCNNSIYSYQHEICMGYITVKGGHRVGITGNCVIENGKVININYISSINFRIARQIIGCSNNVLPQILKIKEHTIYNTLIISPPGIRKNNTIKRYNKKSKQWNKHNELWRNAYWNSR